MSDLPPLPQQYANMTWQSRWNNASADAAVAALTHSGINFMLVSTMGVLRFKYADLPSVIRHFKAALDLLEGQVHEEDRLVQLSESSRKRRPVKRRPTRE